MNKTNILHIIDSLGIGGAEKILVGVVNGLPEHEHHVVYLNGAEDMIALLPDSCKVVNLNYRSRLDILRCAWKLRRYILTNNIRVVHSHLYLATLIARIACPKRVKLFTTIHSLPSRNYFAESPWARLLEMVTYRKWHYIIAICHEVYKDYNRCIKVKGPYSILYNYVEDKHHAADYKKMSFNGQLKLVAVGNLRKPKNYPYLLEVFKRMPANISLDIYGSGPLREELQEEIDRHNLNIRLCGVRQDIQAVLPKYDAFIMSSIFEGQPISLLEAMASGLPAILSDIPVLREVSDNQAIYFDLENTDDLVEKLTAISNHQVSLDEYAQANFIRVKTIADKSRYMQRLQEIYASQPVDRKRETHETPVKIFRPPLPATAS